MMQEAVYIYPQFAKLGFTAGITLKGPYSDSAEVYELIENSLIPSSKKMIVPRQIHGADIALIESTDFKGEADGVISKLKNVCLTVTTADCLPVLFADPSSGYFAAVHVGWRSFVGGILENYFKIANQLGINSATTLAAIGAGIGECCFEVGSDVAMLFNERYIKRRDGKYYIDLTNATGNKIESLGVIKSNININMECTYCHSDKYYSYRRDKHTQVQMVSYIFQA